MAGRKAGGPRPSLRAGPITGAPPRLTALGGQHRERWGLALCRGDTPQVGCLKQSAEPASMAVRTKRLTLTRPTGTPMARHNRPSIGCLVQCPYAESAGTSPGR
jgi:hypothetical protein